MPIYQTAPAIIRYFADCPVVEGHTWMVTLPALGTPSYQFPTESARLSALHQGQKKPIERLAFMPLVTAHHTDQCSLHPLILPYLGKQSLLLP